MSSRDSRKIRNITVIIVALLFLVALSLAWQYLIFPLSNDYLSPFWQIFTFVMITILGGLLTLRMPKGKYIDTADPVYYASILVFGPAVTGWLVIIGGLAGIFVERRLSIQYLSRVSQKLLSYGVGGAIFFAFAQGKELWGDWQRTAGNFLVYILCIIACIFVDNMLDLFLNFSFHPEWRRMGVSFFIYASLGLLIAVLFQIQPLALILLFFPLIIIYKTARNYQELLEEARGVVEVIAETVDERDKYSREHSLKVAYYSEKIARELSLDEEKVDEIVFAAKIHDLGKICVPDSILCKAGHYTDAEFMEMTKHAQAGWQMARNLSICKNEADIIKYHHERYDGRGYPEGLKGEEIPIGSRILLAANAFESMIHPRHYRKTLTVEEAIRQLEEGRGTQFDPLVVDAFVRVIRNEIYPFSSME